MKQMINLYLKTTCISYTFVMIFQTLLYSYNHNQINNELVFLIFLSCAVINLLIHITHHTINHDWLIHVMSVLEIIIIIIGVNFVYEGVLIFELNRLIAIASLAIASYLFVIAIVFFKNTDDARKINEKLKSNRKSNQ